MADRIEDQIILYFINADHDTHLMGMIASLPRRENRELKTCTKLVGPILEFNPDLLGALSIQNASIQFFSEIMHVALLHPARKKAMYAANPEYVDLAFDIATFDAIAHENPIFPEPGAFGLPYGLTGEEYYQLLLKKFPPEKHNGMQDILDGKVQQDHSEWDSVDLVQQQTTALQFAEYAQDVMAKGQDPLGVGRAFKMVKPPVDPWYKILSNVAGHTMSSEKKKYSSKTFSRRYKCPFPGTRHDRKGDLAICIDASGSISKSDLSLFLSHSALIVKQWGAGLRFMCGDSDVYENVLVKNEHDLDSMKLTGGGGTSSVPYFEAMKDNPPDLVIFFTDLETDFPPQAPPYEVIWATKAKGIEVPFGTIFQIVDP